MAVSVLTAVVGLVLIAVAVSVLTAMIVIKIIRRVLESNKR